MFIFLHISIVTTVQRSDDKKQSVLIGRCSCLSDFFSSVSFFSYHIPVCKLGTSTKLYPAISRGLQYTRLLFSPVSFHKEYIVQRSKFNAHNIVCISFTLRA